MESPSLDTAGARGRRTARVAEITVAELVARITAAGSKLKIADLKAGERAVWRRAIHAANTDGGLPAGMRLRYTGRGSGDLVLRLVPDTPENEPRPPEPEAIPVPDRLVRPHSIVAQLRAEPKRMRLSASVTPRALRILQALFTAAEERGYRVEPARERDDAVARIVVGVHSYPLTVTEGQARTPHVPTKAELAEAAKYSWVKPPEYDYQPSGELTISLPEYWRSGHEGRRRTWSDRTRWRLEDKLAHMLVEIAERVELDEQRRLEREAEERERRAAEIRALDHAWERLVADHRALHLRRQMDALRLADEIRSFCATMQSSLASHDTTGIEDVERWLVWAEEHADRIDPRLHPPTMPADPVADAKALEPYLGAGRLWSLSSEVWADWRRRREAGRER
jgi:hypothetical protein